MIKITHKRVRLRDSGYYIFYPFGPILSKGVVTEKSDLILKAIKLEQRISVIGFSLLAALYTKFHGNKELWVAGVYITFGFIVLGCFYFGARLSLMSNTTYDQQDHGNIIKR